MSNKTIEFSREVLLEVKDRQLGAIRWAVTNLRMQVKGSAGFWNWAKYFLRAAKHYIELDEQAEQAKSELME